MSELVCVRCHEPIHDQAVEGPKGWMHVSCSKGVAPARKGVLVFVGCGVLGGFLFLVMLFLATWQFLSPERPPRRAMDAGAVSPIEDRE